MTCLSPNLSLIKQVIKMQLRALLVTSKALSNEQRIFFVANAL